MLFRSSEATLLYYTVSAARVTGTVFCTSYHCSLVGCRLFAGAQIAGEATLMSREKTKAPKKVKLKPRYMHARYSGYCRCGQRISVGELMYYDGANRRSLCVSCGKKQLLPSPKSPETVETVSQAQKLLDRFHQLTAVAESAEVLAELADLKRQLKQHAKNDPLVRRELLRVQTSGNVLAIHARFAGKCCKCGTVQQAGDPVAYDVDRRTIICYECVAD